MKILLIEDDNELARLLIGQFSEQGYVIRHASDGVVGLDEAVKGEFDVLIVDWMLPGLDGLALVKSLRRTKMTPVIFLTTKSGIDDRVQGLEAGADDYLVKPFAFAELLARVRVMARRSAHSNTRLTVGTLEMDLMQRSVTREGRPIDLSPQEFRLLEYMLRHPDRVVTRKMLLEKVWDIHFDPHTSVVESHVSRLRAKLNEGFPGDLIQTIRNTGYKLLAAP